MGGLLATRLSTGPGAASVEAWTTRFEARSPPVAQGINCTKIIAIVMFSPVSRCHSPTCDGRAKTALRRHSGRAMPPVTTPKNPRQERGIVSCRGTPWRGVRFRFQAHGAPRLSCKTFACRQLQPNLTQSAHGDVTIGTMGKPGKWGIGAGSVRRGCRSRAQPGVRAVASSAI